MSSVTRKSSSSQTRVQSDNADKDAPKTQPPMPLNNNETAKAPADVPQESLPTTKLDRESMGTKGYRYVGDMHADKKHGMGVLSFPDDRTYIGAFHADKRHGFGTFQNAENFEYKGLYRHDERFGPGVMTYPSSQHADVGFWLSDDLVRLLYPHPTLNLDIRITDRKPRSDSSRVIPAWYSPYQLLSTLHDFDFILNKKSYALLCENTEEEKSPLARYLVDRADRVQEVRRDKRAQLDAYLVNLKDETVSKETFFSERLADFPAPNETSEQQQLLYHTNQFLPLKQQATFPVDEFLSNTRSAFPEAGPLEDSSLLLCELAFRGEAKQIRNLLMHSQTYVDVCDSRGLTALHFATHNLYLDAINCLLDFGANVNQFTDDGLTPLAIAFLFFYGNNPQETINIALEHSDAIISNPRPAPIAVSRRSSSKEKSFSEGPIADETKSVPPTETNPSDIENSYGYELMNDLRERIRDEPFRDTVHTLIKLLLRRGADPSLSDWPIPVLVLAIRAGDKDMVELLLKKKAQVNCRLSSTRHASLTPLHVACGSLAPTALDMVRLLLEHGAQTNVESSPVDQEYLSLADPLARDTHTKSDEQRHGRTPLHIVCARDISDDTATMTRLLLEHQANPNVVCNGQTPLSLAIAMGNESVVDLLLDHESTDPAVSLGEGNGNALCTVLSTVYESRWNAEKRSALIERMIAKNPRVLYPVRFSHKHSVGSVVDYAYYSFFADTRIAQTSYHLLSPEERVTYKERKELLAHIARRFREEVTKDESLLTVNAADDSVATPSRRHSSPRRSVSLRSSTTEKTKNIPPKESYEFHFCATCGRSTGVRLTPCKECAKVYFCSKACRTTGWDAFHEAECHLLQQAHGSTKVTLNEKALADALADKNASLRASHLYSSSNQLSTLSAAKLIRLRRLKQLGKAPGYLDGVNLSWNYTYDGPENYSFS